MMFRFYKRLFTLRPFELILWAIGINLAKSALLFVSGVYSDYLEVSPLPVAALYLNDVVPLVLEFLIYAPLLETFLFQYLVITAITKIKSLNWKTALLTSSIIFAFAHTEVSGDMYLFYLFDKWIAGLVLALLFIILKRREKKAYIYTAIAHASINCILSIYVLFTLVDW